MSDELLRGLEETWAGLRALLGELGGDDWSRPTPCAEWSVHDLAAHLGAVEGGFQGFPQPDPPEGWADPRQGIDGWTARGVAARRGWTPEQVLDEVARASDAQLSRLGGLDDAGWEEPTMGPLGETTMFRLAQIRLVDLWTHLLDLRFALGRPLEPDREPTAAALVVGRILEMTPWGAVKKAGLADGSRVRLDLSGVGGRTVDLVVDSGRAATVEPEGEVPDRIEGNGVAYAMVVEGRPPVAEAAGGVKAAGRAATALLDRFRIFE